MQSEARRLGARVQTAVSSTTDMLVCGEKTGKAKITKARTLNVTILSEDDYIAIIRGIDRVQGAEGDTRVQG